MEWEDYATKLLDKKLYLSALELYYELLESGHEVHSLRDFFSNPGNFETFYNIPRSTSLQTFDSLDLVSRYSDDEIGATDERITVLEFELRKAQETINALRGTLTTSAAPEHTESGVSVKEASILPYEKRCLNYLISEYLLSHNFTLTSITFSDEITDQDFDDWDDVGLNCPRPPPLLGVYRASDHHTIQMTEKKCLELEEKIISCEDELSEAKREIDLLSSKLEEKAMSPGGSIVSSDIIIVKEDKRDEDNVIVCLDSGNIITYDEEKSSKTSECSLVTGTSEDSGPSVEPIPPITDVSTVDSMNSESTHDSSKRTEVEMNIADATRESPLHLEQGDDSSETVFTEDQDERRGVMSWFSGVSPGVSPGLSPEPGLARQESTLSKDCDTTLKETESEGDMLDNLHFDSPVLRHRPDSSSIPESGLESDDVDVLSEQRSDNVSSSEHERGDDQERDSEQGRSEEAMVEEKDRTEKREESPDPEQSVSVAFAKCVRMLVEGQLAGRLSGEVALIMDEPLLLMGRCLPHIVPHVLLNKREELLPIILCLAVQHPEPTQRDNLLHLLFNLVKRPDFDQRQIIRAGCSAFAANVDRKRLEEELLPQCWEQISDKYVERRLLVSETCGTLAPYLSRDVCSSLVLSILRQVLEDKDESVRESGVKNLAVVLPRIHTGEKCRTLVDILLKSLTDSGTKVQKAASQILLPSLAAWCIARGTFLQSCYYVLLQKLVEAVTSSKPRDVMSLLQSLHVATVFVHCALLQPLVSEQSTELDPALTSAEEAHYNLTEPQIVLGVSSRQYSSLNSHLNTELTKGVNLSEDILWLRDTGIPVLVEALGKLSDKSLSRDFTALLVHMNSVLGNAFTQAVTKPAMKHQVMLPTVLPVYTAGILALEEENRDELREFLLNTVNHFSSQFLPSEPLTETFAELSQIEGLLSLMVDVLTTCLEKAINPNTKGVIAKISKGLCDCANPTDVTSQVFPILFHLANDPDFFVQTATVSAFSVMLQRCTGAPTDIREQLDVFITRAVTDDIHVMMCELIDSFTLILPACTPDIQKDFLIPRLATIGVSNSSVTNKTKRQDIAERLIGAYRAILCSYLAPDTLEHYVIPGLEALLVDCQDVFPDKLSMVDNMLREVRAKTVLSRDAKQSTGFNVGGKMSGFFKKK